MKLFSVPFFVFVALIFTSCFAAKDIQSDSKPISHEGFDSLLQKHVDDNGSVHYKDFLQDSTAFYQYIKLLSANHPNKKHWSKEERLAYWINAYNAFTIQLIIEHFPVKSIKDIKDGTAFINSVWDISFIKIEGVEYDLNNIEHNILRKKFDEPRIHASIVCASQSCPRLLNEAFTADKVNQQLQQQMKRFVNDATKNNIISAEKAELSKIFNWFKGDFTKNGSLINYINQFSETKLNEGADISWLDYDWGLNAQE